MTEAGWTRERKLVDELLTFIEQTSGRKIKFSAIANLKTGVIEDPQDRIAAWLKRHLADSYQQGRVAGLEAASRVAESFPWSRGGRLENPLHIGRREGEKAASEHIAAEIRKLAQQAQDEKGVGNANIKMS